MGIDEWRAEIDEIDRKLLRLLNRRAELAMRVGRWKRGAAMPIRDRNRERDVLSRACRGNTGPLDEGAVRRLFRHIIRESRRVAARVARPRQARVEQERP